MRKLLWVLWLPVGCAAPVGVEGEAYELDDEAPPVDLTVEDIADDSMNEIVGAHGSDGVRAAIVETVQAACPEECVVHPDGLIVCIDCMGNERRSRQPRGGADDDRAAWYWWLRDREPDGELPLDPPDPSNPEPRYAPSDNSSNDDRRGSGSDSSGSHGRGSSSGSGRSGSGGSGSHGGGGYSSGGGGYSGGGGGYSGGGGHR